MKKILVSVFGVLCVLLAVSWRINYDKGNLDKGEDGYIHPVYGLVLYLSDLGDNSFDNAVLKPTGDFLSEVRRSWNSNISDIGDFFKRFGQFFEIICVPLQFLYNTIAWITNITSSVTAFFFTGSFTFEILPVWKF